LVDFVGNRTLPDLLEERGEANPTKPCLIFESSDGTTRSYSYESMADQVYRTANALAALGVKKNDAVTLMLGNCPEFLMTWLGLAHLGAVAVPANTSNTPAEIAHVIRYSESVAVISAARFLGQVKDGLAQAQWTNLPVIAVGVPDMDVPGDAHVLQELVDAADPRRPLVALNSEDPSQMIFTSGTTAAPKAVVHTHANALRAGERVAKSLGLESTDRCLTALPMFHVNAQCATVLPSLTVGGTCVLLENYSASRYWSQVRRHRATQTSLVAMQVRTLLRQVPSEADPDHYLRRVLYAINVTDAEKDQFEKRYRVELVNYYGLSEAAMVVTIAPLYGPKRWPSVGLPAFDREVKVVDRDGLTLPANTAGELAVKGVPGRTLMKGYFKDSKGTDSAIRDGWLYTGDTAYIDEAGYVYFVDRKKDMIKRAGENISASEVEAALLDHPCVADAAVIGVPDAVRDEAVKAFVIVKDGSNVTPERLLEHCSRRLAHFKVPTLLEIRTDLPRTSVGKIEKKLLRQERSY